MEVETEFEFEAVVEMRVNAPSIFWLGGNYIEEEGMWVWDSNGDVINLTQFWDVGHPNVANTGRTCVIMDLNGFQDYNCSATVYAYGCEFSLN